MLDEYQLIQLAQEISFSHPDILLGIGDDAAIVKSETSLVWSTDTLVAGTHFYPNIPPYDLGWKSLAVNLSDIAAMAAQPLAFQLSLALPAHLELTWVQDFFNGLKACSHKYATPLVGGDTVRSDQICITISILGRSPTPLHRSPVYPGEKILLAGSLGSSTAGFYCLEQNLALTPLSQELIKSHYHPLPQLEAAHWLRENLPGKGKLMDISDGLVSALASMCQPSKLGCVVQAGLLPIPETVKTLGSQENQSWLDWGLYGGEDYGLLLALPEPYASQAEKSGHFKRIGEIISEPQFWLDSAAGRQALQKHLGFQHF